MSPMHFKLSKADSHTRRLAFSEPPTWQLLASRLEGLYGIPIDNIGVSYLDNDNDEITLSSDQELQDYYLSYYQAGKDAKFHVLDLSLAASPATNTAGQRPESVNRDEYEFVDDQGSVTLDFPDEEMEIEPNHFDEATPEAESSNMAFEENVGQEDVNLGDASAPGVPHHPHDLPHRGQPHRRFPYPRGRSYHGVPHHAPPFLPHPLWNGLMWFAEGMRHPYGGPPHRRGGFRGRGPQHPPSHFPHGPPHPPPPPPHGFPFDNSFFSFSPGPFAGNPPHFPSSSPGVPPPPGSFSPHEPASHLPPGAYPDANLDTPLVPDMSPGGPQEPQIPADAPSGPQPPHGPQTGGHPSYPPPFYGAFLWYGGGPNQPHGHHGPHPPPPPHPPHSPSGSPHHGPTDEHRQPPPPPPHDGPGSPPHHGHGPWRGWRSGGRGAHHPFPRPPGRGRGEHHEYDHRHGAGRHGWGYPGRWGRRWFGYDDEHEEEGIASSQPQDPFPQAAGGGLSERMSRLDTVDHGDSEEPVASGSGATAADIDSAITESDIAEDRMVREMLERLQAQRRSQYQSVGEGDASPSASGGGTNVMLPVERVD